jgi:hypothetical protein
MLTSALASTAGILSGATIQVSMDMEANDRDDG